MRPFNKLFEPGRIGKLQLKNRIIMPPMIPNYVTADGRISEKQIDYYTARARGGAGVICIESTYPRSGGHPGRIRIDDDEVIPGLIRLVEAIHDGGAKAAIEMNPHRGRADEFDPASASETTHPKSGIRVRALTIADIKKLVDEFGEGARRAKGAGFDCLIIHGGSGYLASEFLSPRTNKRTDEYGGDVLQRARFALELVAAVKEKAGPDYPIIYRICADEKLAGGISLDDVIIASRLLEEAGVDAIDVTSGVAIETISWGIPYMYMPRGYNAPLSQAIKKEVGIPVCLSGRINDPYLAEEILKEAKADFVDLGRALIADPEFPNKALTGRAADICKCIACGRCLESVLKPPASPMICSVNPAVGREKEFELGLKPATKKKRVLVIGGGPAGMEAAIIASQRGHDVTLWGKDYQLGGQLNLAIVPPGKEELKNFLDYLTHRLDELHVNVKLGKEATVETVLEFSPDAVTVAVGSKLRTPEINGIGKRKVISFRDVLSEKVAVANEVIVIGGGFIGCETADFLAGKGKEVTIIELLPELASEFFYPYADLLIKKLKEKRVKVFTGVKEEEITEKGVEITDKHGKRISLYADNIVIATGLVADESLFDSLKGKVSELYRVGDCVEAGRIYEAISSGAEVGLKIGAL